MYYIFIYIYIHTQSYTHIYIYIYMSPGKKIISSTMMQHIIISKVIRLPGYSHILRSYIMQMGYTWQTIYPCVVYGLLCFPWRDLEIPVLGRFQHKRRLKLLWWTLFEETAETDSVLHTRNKNSPSRNEMTKSCRYVELIRLHILVYCMELRQRQPCSDSVAPCWWIVKTWTPE